MKNPFRFIACLLAACFCTTAARAQTIPAYTPADPALYDTILRLDSSFFAAYNTCTEHLQEYSDFYAEDLEFYHDKGGLSTSKKDVVESTRKNICGKVTRELVRGSVEVYPVAGFGAVEIGYHTFRNRAESNTPSKPDRFVVVWQRTPAGWKIKRVISLH